MAPIAHRRHRSGATRKEGWGRALVLALALSAAPVTVPEASAEARSRGEAIEQAVRMSGGEGRVLGVRESTAADGTKTYAVKVLTDGRVRVYRIRGR